MGCVGLAGSIWSLTAMVVLGGLGVAAFHPEAAAVAGAAMPEDRSRGMSLFVTGGFLGQAVGPLGSGYISERYGMSALAWNLVWGLLVLVALRPQRLGAVLEPTTAATKVPISARWLLRHRRKELGGLFFAGLLRVLPAAGTPLALAFWLKHNGAGNGVIGLNQSAFYLGIGLGGLSCAVVTRRSHERSMLWMLPMLGVPVLACLPQVGARVALGCSFAVGLIVGLGLPVFTSYGQRLLPEGQRIASSITMGVTWGLGLVIVAGTDGRLHAVQSTRCSFLRFLGRSPGRWPRLPASSRSAAPLSMGIEDAPPGRGSQVLSIAARYQLRARDPETQDRASSRAR